MAAICLAFNAFAQVTEKDTIDYIPEFYTGALDYNLMIAASKGLDTEIERLIMRGADVEAETEEGATALVIAVANIKPFAVNTLLIYNSDPNKVTASRETPLLIILKKLVSLEAKENRMLYDYVEAECLNIAESLIRYGADIDYQDIYGATALNYAAIYGSLRFADLLLYYMADIDKKAKDGTTPLMAAIWAGNANVADLLVQNGANLEARDANGFTPFLIAAQNGDTLLLNYLMKKGVDIYEMEFNGWDALSIAVKHNHIDAAEMLIRSGNGWNDTDREGPNYYNIAVKFGRKEMFELLERNNFPEKYRPAINQVDISVSGKSNFSNLYTGINVVFTEPGRRIGFTAGFDTRLWYSTVMVKESDQLYYQFLDKSSLVYAGITKDIPLTDNPVKGNLYFTGSLAGGYFFGNRFKGTRRSPDNEFKIIPAVRLRYQGKDFGIYGGIEYTGNDFYKSSPVWFRAGISCHFDFIYSKAPLKTIRWY
jgi:ankyrin repeat protein